MCTESERVATDATSEVSVELASEIATRKAQNEKLLEALRGCITDEASVAYPYMNREARQIVRDINRIARDAIASCKEPAPA